MNTADVAQLAAEDVVGFDLAHRIVEVRQRRGPFRDLADLVDVLGLQPHELVRLRDRVIVGRPNIGPDQARGRVLDY